MYIIWDDKSSDYKPELNLWISVRHIPGDDALTNWARSILSQYKDSTWK